MYDSLRGEDNGTLLLSSWVQILGSAYLLGGTHQHLHDIYEKEAGELEPWRDSPGEISVEDWREFLGKREYVMDSFCKGGTVER